MGVLDNDGLKRLWQHIWSNLNDKISKTTPVIDGKNYGEELPESGVEGQLYFKKVT